MPKKMIRISVEAWKPYMKNLDTLYTDATCYDSAIVGYDCPCQG